MERLSPQLVRIATASAAAAALAIAVVALSVQVVPAWLSLLEGVTGHGFDIEMLLRIHFAYATWLLLQVVFFRLCVLPVRDPRARIVLGSLALAGLILIAIWILDRDARFTGEASALTFFSAALLGLCALVAWLNRRAALARAGAHPVEPLFWSLVGFAFLYAGLDEFFTIHERLGLLLAPLGARIGLAENVVNDLVTVGYVIGAVVFVLLFRGFVRAELMRGARASGWLLIGGIGLYAVSVLNDSVDVVVARLAPHTDPEHFMNFLEETLEFAAAALFLSSFLVRFVESEGDRVAWLTSTTASWTTHPLVRAACAASVAATLLASALLALLSRDPPPVIAEPGYAAIVYGDVADGLDESAGLVFDPVRGLLVANVGAATVVRLDGSGGSGVVAGPAHGLASAAALAVDGTDLFVADPVGKQVLRLDASGSVTSLAHDGWRAPAALAVDAAGRLVAADSALAVVVLLDAGNPEAAEPVLVASALDGLVAPSALAFGGEGALYVADPGAGSVFRIAQDGGVERFLDARHGLREPVGLAYRAGWLWVSDRSARTVSHFDPDGGGGAVITFAPRVRELAGLAFDPDGALYVAVRSDYQPHNRVYRVRGLP